MKNLMLLLVLAISAAAQSAPVKATATKSGFSFLNTGTKSIVAIVATANDPAGKTAYLYRHDFYFKTHSIMPGEIDTPDTTGDKSGATVKVVFLQFDDGSTWGDLNDNRVQVMLSQRKDVLDFLNQLNNAADDAEFTTILNAPQPPQTSVNAKAGHLRILMSQYGIAATRGFVADGIEAAKLRKF